ncbi:MAG TPA: NAD(P)-binding domain-containing protein [Actinopolymorphaceae bacterium]
MTETMVDVVVIGAGQAGLSTAYFLRKFGFTPGSGLVVLDGSPGPGGAWQRRPRSLTMRTVHGISDLPGIRLPRHGIEPDRPVREVVPDYFAAYEHRLGLEVLRPVRARAVERGDDERLHVETDKGRWSARAVVNATGTWDRPYWPYYPGREDFRGRQLHTADYDGPEQFAGLDVVVVGGGHSAIQVLSEIAQVAASTTWVTRRPPVFRDEEFTPEIGRAVVAAVEERVRAGLPPASVVSATGITLSPHVRAARDHGVLERLPLFDRIVADGVVWDDGGYAHADAIVWATGYRPVIDHLAPLRLREPGGGIRLDGTRAVREPRLHLVGYGPSASTIGANRAGRTAAREIRDLLRGASRRPDPKVA